MTGGRTPSTRYLILRSLYPSAISGVLCFCFSVVVVGIHLVLLSLTAGTSLPTLFDGQWGIAYTNYVVGPLERVTNNLTVNNVLVIVLWGVVGLGVYVIFEFIGQFFSDWRHAEHDIEISGEGRVVLHPARRTFFTTILWRMSVLCFAVIGFIAVQPLIEQVFKAGPRIVLGTLPTAQVFFELCLSVAIWMCLAHGVVVILRLFLMRTRLFGDPTIE
jgi:hypothetical protein